MDPSRSGAVLARHAGIDEKTGQLTGDEDGGPRRLVISSDFYKVYESAGKKADGLVNLYCWAHVRRHIVRAGDANPGQLKYWTDAWLEPDPGPLPRARRAHGRLAGEHGARRAGEVFPAAGDEDVAVGSRR